MLFNLRPSLGAHHLDKFRSHSHKPLRVHTDGVFIGVQRHTINQIALLAALWHDTGKLNPNFQPKLDGKKSQGYDHHSYLSVLIFLAYYSDHRNIGEIGLDGITDVLQLITLIAHHHGHLPYMRNILSQGERNDLFAFINSQPEIPAAEFMVQYGFAAPINIQNSVARELWNKLNSIAGDQLKKLEKPLDYWLDTQFNFAALIESDKRDAGDNKEFRRQVQLDWAKEHFSEDLKATFDALEVTNELNRVRTDIRNEAVESLSKQLKSGARVFSLTAPTGAGKTFTLLALANEIRRQIGEYGVIYGLPFLSITEQVEEICRKIWKAKPDFVSRFDSRAHDERLDELIARAETDPEVARELDRADFSAQTFDAAFSITTFVQIFETLLSNRNATLLKLPNFAKTIFLLDEIQALPPRLYIFLTAYLQRFCEKFDCYAILSTATMPHLELVAQTSVNEKLDPRLLFKDYKKPAELLDYKKFFAEDVFSRYCIEPQGEWNMSQLADAVEKEAASTLVILNTIQDTRTLYKELTENRDLGNAHVILLNTHFHLNDRRAKIEATKNLLGDEVRIILISTQLIEAGVDVDFAVVMRDLCPLPNLIQSAGRCNRNGKLKRGRVLFFTLVDEKGKPRAHSIYRLDADQNLLRKTIASISEPTLETDLLKVQQAFFEDMAKNFEIGRHPLWIKNEQNKMVRDEHTNLVEYMRDFNFPVVGSFSLIDKADFGDEFQIYVPESDEDENWKKLNDRYEDLVQSLDKKISFHEKKRLKVALAEQIKAMSGRVLSVRCSKKNLPYLEPDATKAEPLCGLYLLVSFECDYNSEEGLKFKGESTLII